MIHVLAKLRKKRIAIQSRRFRSIWRWLGSRFFAFLRWIRSSNSGRIFFVWYPQLVAACPFPEILCSICNTYSCGFLRDRLSDTVLCEGSNYFMELAMINLRKNGPLSPTESNMPDLAEFMTTEEAAERL